MSNNLSTPVLKLNGIGKARAEKLDKLGIRTLRDLIYYFPRSYENRGDVKTLGMHDTDRPHSYILTVASEVHSVLVKKGMTLSKFRAFDESGSCEVVYFNSPFVKDVFHVGTTFRFFGKTSFSKARRLILTAPKYEPIIDGVELDEFKPIYSLTEGISSKILEKHIKSAIDELLPMIEDPIPEDIRLKFELPTLSHAIRNIHFPKDNESIARAGRRLAFDEMLYFALGISLSAGKRQLGEGVPFAKCSLDEFVSNLPYELTGAQKRAINDIYRDTVVKRVDGKTPTMSRILIGDVGSGKTVCAAAAAYIAFKSKYQTAIMVPTEILAHQHYEDLGRMLGKLGMQVRLLTGSTTPAAKRKI
jgi:ATP-dependent DNA helicase RecG